MVFWMCRKLYEVFSSRMAYPTFSPPEDVFLHSLSYLFVGQTTHIGALYQAFLKMHLTAKVPRILSTLLLAYNKDLFGALTHYSSGYATIYYGVGYVKLRDFFKLGILMAFINMTICGLIGALWWKIIGLY
uniref:Putative sodium/sulfate symporter n=1 Tax=Helianthus annuus TaxID=4232 RepID=A0A251S6G8_HELAN